MTAQGGASPVEGPLFRAARAVVMAQAVVAGVALLVMIALVCADVVMRFLKQPISGADDLVGILAMISLAGALPYTTAVKGHVAVEYFVHKLSRRWRAVAEAAVHLVSIAMFLLLAWGELAYGLKFHQWGQVTMTLQMPVFWMPWVLACSFVMTAGVLTYNMLRPHQELVKP